MCSSKRNLDDGVWVSIIKQPAPAPDYPHAYNEVRTSAKRKITIIDVWLSDPESEKAAHRSSAKEAALMEFRRQ